MKEANTNYFPSDFANHLRKIWNSLIAGQYTPPPLPKDLQLRSFLETIYLASMEREESRNLCFAACATPESFQILQEDEAETIEVWPFAKDRQLTVQEIRRLASATHLDSSAIWVRFPADDSRPMVIHGIINFGSSWAHARRGYQYHYDQIPHSFLLRAEGPGRLVAYQGQYRVAALIGGQIIEAVNISPLELVGAHPLFSEAHDLLRTDVVPPEYEVAREWHQFEWTAIINVILSVVNTIQANGHGGALIFASKSCDLNDFLRIKYKLSDEAKGLRKHFVHFLNLRHKYGDMVWPPQFKEGAPEAAEETKRLTMSELLEAQRKLAETCMFAGNLAGVDGSIVIGTDLKIKGFGSEILLDKAIVTKVFEAREPLNETMEEMDSESFGMRHRSAMRLCGSTTGLAVLVVSQDGEVSLVWNDKGRCCFKRGIQTANANMVLA